MKRLVTETRKKAMLDLFEHLEHDPLGMGESRVEALRGIPDKKEHEIRKIMQQLQSSGKSSKILKETDRKIIAYFLVRHQTNAILGLFRRLQGENQGLSQLQADALRSIPEAVSARFGQPGWRDDTAIAIHLDRSMISGGATAMHAACAEMTHGLGQERCKKQRVNISGHKAHGTPFPIDFRIPSRLNQRIANTDAVTSLALELGPESWQARAVVSKKKTRNHVRGKTMVLGEDFGFVNTSSMALVRCDHPINMSHLEFAKTDPGKKQVREFLESHVSGDDVEVIERFQFSGRAFLDCVAGHASEVDRTNREINRGYNRVSRLKSEMNRLRGCSPEDEIPAKCDFTHKNDGIRKEYKSMHRCFFNLLENLYCLKARRRGIYRKVAGLKNHGLAM